MSEVRHWEALTREEISAVAPDALLVLPVGTTEQHGPHLATGTDAALVSAVAERAAALAAQPEVVLLAPTLAFGASDHHVPFGGTLSLRVSTLQAVLADLLASAAAAGCRRVFVLNGHGGNVAPCAIAVSEASREHGILAATALFSQLLDPAALELQVAGHAGVFETSLMLALHPDRVRAGRATPSPGGARPRLAAGAGRRRAEPLAGAGRLHRPAGGGDGRARRGRASGGGGCRGRLLRGGGRPRRLRGRP